MGTEGAEVSSEVGVGVEKVFRGNLVTRLSSSLCPSIVAFGVGAGTRTVVTGTASGDGDTTRTPASTVHFRCTVKVPCNSLSLTWSALAGQTEHVSVVMLVSNTATHAAANFMSRQQAKQNWQVLQATLYSAIKIWRLLQIQSLPQQCSIKRR